MIILPGGRISTASILGALVSACASPVVAPTPVLSTITPPRVVPPTGTSLQATTPTFPSLSCSPPPCRANEVYFCSSGNGPGGCGTGCATKTPDPRASACTIQRTRTPAPNAPTIITSRLELSGKRVDPHVELCASARGIKVGETLTVIAEAVDIALPVYVLYLKDGGKADYVPIVQVSYANQIKMLEGPSQMLELVLANGTYEQGTFILRAHAAGTTQLKIVAAGDVRYADPATAVFGKGDSESIAILVSNP